MEEQTLAGLPLELASIAQRTAAIGEELRLLRQSQADDDDASRRRWELMAPLEDELRVLQGRAKMLYRAAGVQLNDLA